MSAENDLTQWVVGAVAAGGLTLLGFLAKFVFDAILKRLDSIAEKSVAANRELVLEMRAIAAQVQNQGTAQALTELRVSRLETDFASQRLKYEDLTGFLQGQGFRKRDG